MCKVGFLYIVIVKDFVVEGSCLKFNSNGNRLRHIS